jgi:hypothetical protein
MDKRIPKTRLPDKAKPFARRDQCKRDRQTMQFSQKEG